MPRASASSTSGPNRALLSLTSAIKGWVARLTTNSPVATTLASVSLSPTDANDTIGGLAHATLKNECGARLPTPSASTVEIQAIGRGTTSAVSSLYGLTSGSSERKTVRIPRQ